MNNEPIALQLADALLRNNQQSINIEAAAELRMQNNALINADDTRNRLIRRVTELEARIAELEAQLAAIDAGGVEPLRKRECLHQISEPAQPVLTDAYVGAREDLAIWKKRALEAEALNRKFAASVNGPTFMGEPSAQAAPVDATVQQDAARYRFLRDGIWRRTDLEPVIRLQLNTLWDSKIDAAIDAQKGSND